MPIAVDEVAKVFDQLQAYLGHRNITHTVRYSELAANRFDGFWRGVRARSIAGKRWAAQEPPFAFDN